MMLSVWLRHLNQDPLEIFFGAIRSYGCRNNNATCDQFENSFATLLVNNLNSGHIRGKNCEGDFCDALHTLLITENSEAESTETLDFSEFIDKETRTRHSIQELEKYPTIMAPLEYVNGYLKKNSKVKSSRNAIYAQVNLWHQKAMRAYTLNTESMQVDVGFAIPAVILINY